MDEFILGVDLDGVCANYTKAFRQVVARKREVDPNQLPLEVSWDFAEWGLSGHDEFVELHAEAVLRRRVFATMEPYEGVAETLWRLSDAGVWIRIITHRLIVKDGHAVAVADTVTWLDAHGIPYRDLLFLGNKPQVEADCYIDDAPHNVEALRRQGNRVIVFDQPYNRHLGGLRAGSWGEVEDHVMRMLAERG